MNIKANLKRGLVILISPLKIFVKNRKVYILRVDGGICSQIKQYIVGKYLTEKGNEVFYNLDWYRKEGVDLDGKYPRNFELTKMFRDIDIEDHHISKAYFWLLKLLYYNLPGETLDVKEIKAAPQFLDGYYIISDLNERKRLEQKYLMPYNPVQILDEANIKVYNLIKEQHRSVGVHIRRGDMSKDGLSPDYYIKAMHLEAFRSAGFFLFSDEISWIVDYIEPHIQDLSYRIVDINDSSSGWRDLYLIMQCDHFIASQGTMAKMAYELKNDANSIIVLPDYYKEGGFQGLPF